MAIRFKPCFSSFKSQIVEAKSHISQSFSPISFPNKWNIVEDGMPTSYTNPGRLCINLSEKLDVVKHELWNVGENSMDGLYMIDAMQRLNIDYHFQDEIEAFLGKQYSNYRAHYAHALHEVSLLFRLLRQQGHFVPPEVFDKFLDKEGKFNTKQCASMKGVMDLYEASHLSIAGEDILDEAGLFSERVLRQRLPHSNNHEAKFLRRTLSLPFHKSLSMFTAKSVFLDDFCGTDHTWLSSLKEVAKMDFISLQSLHRHEILQVSKWWKGLGLANELKHARNQPLKWYVWSLACLTDPTLSEERVDITKQISLIYILDDIYDVYGTIEELTLFTEAVSRWDLEATEGLPDYMKTCFMVLYNLTNQISSKIYQKHGWDPTHSLRKTWEKLCRAFLVEAEWFGSGKLPSGDEYLKNGIVSCGVHIVLVHILFLLGEGLTMQNVDNIDTMPAIISSPATILRLWDDLGNAQDENQEGNDGSYVDCLMMDEKGMSMKRARKEVMSKISEAWKRLNQESLFGRQFPTSFTKAALNLARMVPLMYSYDDNHSLPGLEEQVKSLLYDNATL